MSALKPNMFDLVGDKIVLSGQPQLTLRQELPHFINANAIGNRKIYVNGVVVDMHTANPMSQLAKCPNMTLTLPHAEKGEVVLTVMLRAGNSDGGAVLPRIGFVNLASCRDLHQMKVSERTNKNVSLASTSRIKCLMRALARGESSSRARWRDRTPR